MSPSDDYSLVGKIAFVTGIGSLGEGWGNGRAIATLLARRGARIYGVDRDLEAARHTQKLIAAEGGVCEISTCDVTRSADIAAAVADCNARLGVIDILINNVGQSEPGDPVTQDEETWAGQIDLNLKSVFLVSRAVIPQMTGRGGAIVNISSVAGMRYVGKPQVGYAAGKAGMVHYTHTAAVELARDGIRMNCVVPGLMATPLLKRLADRYAGGDYEGFTATRNKQVPMGRMGDAWDVAHAVLFLASDEAGYITGAEILADGGLTSRTQ